MKIIVITMLGLFTLAGCAAFEEAYYVDREYGQASRAAMEEQIIYKDYRHADKEPIGAEGIVAEEIMETYIDSFGEESTDVDVFQLGIDQ
jgi:hypothetical protein